MTKLELAVLNTIMRCTNSLSQQWSQINMLLPWKHQITWT